MITKSIMRRASDLIGAVVLAARLARHDAWTPARLAAYQRARALRIIRHAAANTRLYGNLYREIALDGTLDLRCLPPVNKALLMDDVTASVTDSRLTRALLEQQIARASGDDYLFGSYRVVATAGTSGLRGLFVYDRAAWRTVIANTLRWQRFAGVTPRFPRRTRICTIGADNPMHVTSRIPLSGDVGLFRLEFVEANQSIATQVAALNRFQPDVLLPYPSIAALLAREQIEGRLDIRPRIVGTHSELLTPDMERVIAQAWGAPPFNHYGATEEPHVAIECSVHQGMHVLEDTTMLEVVDDDLRPVPAGVMGTRWLLTNLYNFAQPLIRYEITDMLRLASSGFCPCGRPFVLLDAVGGRAEDMLRLPRSDGTGEITLTPMLLTLAIESFIGVHDYVAEHDTAGIRVQLVVPAPEARRQVEATLVGRLRSEILRNGAVPPPITLSFVPALDRSAQWMGKHAVVRRGRGPAPTGPTAA
jgi:phenylacetate-coenzyme A ligase PaaK-like adenylate-forming protein